MTTTGLVDFHCHLDLYPNHSEAVTACERDQIYTLAVTTTPRAWPRNHELAAATRYVRAALGIHPQLVAQHAAELALWEQYLPQTRYVGEVGLDGGPAHYRSLALQKQVFERVLVVCERAGGKVLSVHSVRTAKVVLDMIEAHLPSDRGRVVLHWFSGSKSEARRAVELGCYFSINIEMLRNERNRELIALLPTERILSETDGPFTQTNGRPSCPADIVTAVDMLAAQRRVDAGDMTRTIQANLRLLLSFV